ncbi:MAG: FAD-linked oxidase C-terminal domain-containing protein [Desulfobulbales bacterium]|nr:FAD-linked oxidase C-terminal domain-containing protein [Desulfobulbales bacterium]
MDKRTLKKLAAIVGPDHLTTAREDLLCYSYDGSALEYLPAAVIFPASTAEVGAIMRLASTERFAVVPRGAGTGMTGGALPVEGGLVMAMSRLNRIIEIDRDNQIAVVEPGVITGRFQEEVERLGLFYPPDPASRKFCTIGGNVGECAGGPRAVKYGVTRDYVLGLEAVLADGRIIKTGVRTAKGVAGYDLTRLLVGSEGTLAIITKITLRLLARPTASTTFLLLFDTIHSATGMVGTILSNLTPCTLEYMDRTALRVVAGNIPFKLPENTEALLLVELDGNPRVVEIQAEELTGIVENRPGLLEIRRAGNQAEAERLWEARRAISPSTFKLKPHKIGEDVVVPRTRIPELVRFTEELAAELDLIILTFGHAGDGNIHVNIMLDRDNPRELAAGRTATHRLFEAVLKMDGTITGEHGIGITKAAFLDHEIDPPSLAVMQAIKQALDPLNILNPGKIFRPAANRSAGIA